MSVAAILRKHAKWTPAKTLVEMVMKELGIGDREAYRKIKKAWKNKEIKKVTLPDRSVLYGLPEFGPLGVNLSKVIAATERLWDILMRPATREEIAFETGIPPEEAEKLAYKTAPQTGWFNPSPEIIAESTRKLGEVLYCEALMKTGKVREDGKSDDFNYEDDMQIIEEAKCLRYLKEYPTILAVIDRDGNFVSWSREAEKYLRGYKPKDRRSPTLEVIRFGPTHNPWRPHSRIP